MRQRLGGDDQEARVVLLPVGDVALDDLEPVERRRVLARNRRARPVAGGGDEPGRAGRVVLGVDADAVQVRQEQAALGEGLGVAADALDVRQPDAVERQEAVLDLDDLLADDVQPGRREQVVDARDGAGRRVLDREHGAVGVAALERLQRRPERPVSLERGAADGREVAPGRRVAVAAGVALVGHAQRPGPVLLADGLELDRVAQDLAEQRRGEVAVDAGVLGERLDASQQVVLAVGVLDRQRVVVGLDGGHAGDEPLALGQGLDEAAVDGVEAVAEVGEVGHGAWATKKPAGRGGLGSEPGACGPLRSPARWARVREKRVGGGRGAGGGHAAE